jgi:NAD(P)-dependent dehydrogenase (short-subunit alcohol dehydrogenase family)
MKTILITGASSGIGKVTAQYFAAKGWQVIATMRKPEAETELNKVSNIMLLPLDVLNQDSIDLAISTAISKFGRIDTIVNNAGYGAVGAFESATTDQVQRQFDTNVFGVFNVIRSILPHFRANKAGTIINVASMGGRITFPLYSLYHGTKWAVEGFSESLAFELREHGIKVRIIEPGAIKTDFYHRSMDLFSKPGLTAYDNYTNLVMPNMQQAGEDAPGPIVVAQAIYKAATDTGNKLRYPVGGAAPALLVLRRLIPDSWFMGIVRMVVEKKTANK